MGVLSQQFILLGIGMELYQQFARYHKWAYQVLFKSLDQIDEQDYFAERGLVFKSIHGTLNHLYFGDKIWFCRFADQAHQFQSVYDKSFDNYIDGKNMLLTQCDQWIAFVDQLNPASLPEFIETRHVNNRTRVTPYLATLHHVFNHATHHRGQLSAAVTQLNLPAPEMDLLYYLIEKSGQHPGKKG
ncbi:MAG: DinB family protein [Pseudomonadota bacterium]